MDNNQTPQAPQQPNPSIIQQPQSSGGGNKMMLWVVLALIVIVLAGGAYWYFMRQKSNPASQNPPSVKQTPKTESSLDDNLNSIDVQASEGVEFSALEADLKSL